MVPDPITLWLINEGKKLATSFLDQIKEKLMIQVGLKTPPTLPLDAKAARQLLDEYLEKIAGRFDEDRLANLYGALSELRDASKTKAKRQQITQATHTLYQLTNIPPDGVTGDQPNSQIRAIAYLALAAAHSALGADEKLIAQEFLEAIAADSEVVTQWVGKRIVQKVGNRFPELTSASTSQPLQLMPTFKTKDSERSKLTFTNPTLPQSTLPVFTSKQGTLLHKTEGNFYDVAWSPDGKHIAAVSGSGIKLWKVGMTDLREYTTMAKDQDTSLYSLAFSPDGQHIAVGCGNNKAVDLYEVVTGHKRTFPMVYGKLYQLAWSPNGKQIAVVGSSEQGFYIYNNKRADDFFLHVWEAASSKKAYAKKIFAYQSLFIKYLVCWSRDGRYIALGSNRDNHISILDAMTGKEMQNFQLTKSTEVTSIAFSPDSRTIAICGESGEALIITLNNGRVINSKMFTGTQKVAWSSDGNHIAYAGKQGVAIYSYPAWKNLYTYIGHTDTVRAFVWAPDSTRIVSISRETSFALDNRSDLLHSFSVSNNSLHVWQAI